MIPDPNFDNFLSHPEKLLRVHIKGVIEGVVRHTANPVAYTSALIHDFGKLNPNFQPKLQNEVVKGYSHHAYLSAFAYLCFCQANQELAKTIGVSTSADFFSVIALIAHHHGNLPNFQQILSETELEELENFLQTNPSLPCSDYLKQWYPHTPFDLLAPANWNAFKTRCNRMPDAVLEKVNGRLVFFQDTQYNFATLIESDKRDAGDNKRFMKDEQLKWMSTEFSTSLKNALPQQDKNALNNVRTEIREEAIQTLTKQLGLRHRVFSLTAPTGSGKTLTLLSAADIIRQQKQAEYHSILYSLPFLTITEQVESICQTLIFRDKPEMVTRIDSRSHDSELERLLEEMEESPDKVADLMSRAFSVETFDAAFTITTFVQFFEALLSNRNATLLRLPNFAKCIFLVDEIQALPPRLYIFFTAYLQAFCEKFDSYAIISTATMPTLELPESTKNLPNNINPHVLFSGYKTPPALIESDKYYGLDVFDRYIIRSLNDEASPITIEELALHIEGQNNSCLVVLNTIDDSRNLYNRLSLNGQVEEFQLLNTRFTLEDRREKLKYCKNRLKDKKRIVLVSTQLIEAGVDIDFPNVYRDLCLLPSVIQSAGRCNRNGDSSNRGTVWFFELHNDGKSRAELVYRDQADKDNLNFSRKRIRGAIHERDLLEIQTEFFDSLAKNLEIGRHSLIRDSKRVPCNLIHHINELDFEVVGSFQLIDEKEFGFEFRYYVPQNDDDQCWEDLQKTVQETAALIRAAKGKLPFEIMKERQIGLSSQLSVMSNRVVTFRVYNKDDAPLAVANAYNNEPVEVCGLRRLLLPDIDYNKDTGIQTHGSGIAIF